MQQALSGAKRQRAKLRKIRRKLNRSSVPTTLHRGLLGWVGWSVGCPMAINLSKGCTYLNWFQWIPSAVGVSVGEGKPPSPNLPQLLGNAGLPTRVYSFGLFESADASAAILRWAGLSVVQAVDYHALRERDIERLADQVEQHLDIGRLRSLCGLSL